MNNYAKTGLVLVIAAVVGYAFGRYVQPARIEIRTETVTKEVETKHNNIVTTEHTVKQPDGTIITDTEIKDTSFETKKETQDVKSDTVVQNAKPQWKVNLMSNFQAGPLSYLYGASVERRILGPVFVGAFGNVDQKYGVTVGIEF